MALVRTDPRDEWEQARDAGHRDGFEAGYEAGMTLAEADVNAALTEHRRATERLVRAARSLEEGHRKLLDADRVELDAIEADVIELALSLATELLGRELRATDHPVRDALTRAMRFVPERATPVAVVHPDDAAVAAEILAADPQWRGGVEIVADPGVEPGGCILEIGECRVDGQLGSALARMREALAAD